MGKRGVGEQNLGKKEMKRIKMVVKREKSRIVREKEKNSKDGEWREYN